MMLRLKMQLLAAIVSFAFCGCAEEPVTPPPAPPGNDAPATPDDHPEAALDEGGADAALPPEERVDN